MNLSFPSFVSTAMPLEICLKSSFSLFPNSKRPRISYCVCNFNWKFKNLTPCNNYHFFVSNTRNLKIPPLEANAAAKVVAEILEDSTHKSGFQSLVWPSPEDEVPFWKREFPSWDISSDDSASAEKDSDLMHIIHVTAEMAPIAKVGGLGDVVTGLARACLSRGHKVDVMLPFYECIPRQYINDWALVHTYI